LRSTREGGGSITPQQVLIKFESNKRIDAGVQGDHGVILLVCALPENFADITCGDVDFLIDGKQKLKRHFSENQNGDIYVLGNTLYILLPRCYTAGTSLRVQVGGRTSDGENKQLVWTPLSETIVFGRSISAGYGCTHGASRECRHDCGEGKGCENPQLAQIRDLVIDSHSHRNMEAISQIGVDGDGGLTIGGQSLFQLVTDVANASLAGILTRLDAIEGAMDGTAAALNPHEE